MSIEAMKQALEALEKLWDIIDDIDTYGDMAKADDKLYRSLVERRQRQRFETTGISTDGYELSGGAITTLRTAIEEAEKQEPVAIMTVLHLKDRTEIGYAPRSAGYDLPTGEYKLYTTPPAAPVQWTDRMSIDSTNELTQPAAPVQEEIQRLTALVRAQQITIEKLEAQQQWVGLTDEEIGDALSVWELTEEWPTSSFAWLKSLG